MINFVHKNFRKYKHPSMHVNSIKIPYLACLSIRKGKNYCYFDCILYIWYLDPYKIKNWWRDIQLDILTSQSNDDLKNKHKHDV